MACRENEPQQVVLDGLLLEVRALHGLGRDQAGHAAFEAFVATPAMTRAASIRQTVSIARLACVLRCISQVQHTGLEHLMCHRSGPSTTLSSEMKKFEKVGGRVGRGQRGSVLKRDDPGVVADDVARDVPSTFVLGRGPPLTMRLCDLLGHAHEGGHGG